MTTISGEDCKKHELYPSDCRKICGRAMMEHRCYQRELWGQLPSIEKIIM